MKKYKLISLIFFICLLTGCVGQIEKGNYKCYLGNMVISSFSIDKDEIKQKKIQSESLSDNTDNEYFVNIYPLKDQDEVDSFYKDTGSNIKSDEKNKYQTLKENQMMIYFIADIPKGYEAYKRDNIQGELVDQGNLLLTDNFYYYSSRTDFFYCLIDLKKKNSITADGTYSFFYITSNKYKDTLIPENIRVIYNITNK